MTYGFFKKNNKGKKFFSYTPLLGNKKYFGVILFRKNTISQFDLLLGKNAN